MSVHALMSSMDLFTAAQVISGWATLVQPSISDELQPVVEQVSARLGEILQAQNCKLTARLFQEPAEQPALLSGYRALESLVKLYSDGEVAFEPLIEGLATAIRSELTALSDAGQLPSPEDDIPDEATVDRYEAALQEFLPIRHRRIVHNIKHKGRKAIRAAIRAFERNIDQASLTDLEGMLEFLKEFSVEGTTISLGYDCLLRKAPKGFERAFTSLRLRIVNKLLQQRAEVSYTHKTLFRFLYDNTVMKRFEMKYTPSRCVIYVSDHKEVTPDYNTFAKPIMIKALEDTAEALRAELDDC